MDESTNSLDFNTEQAILKEVNMLKGKKTILIIAHRSTALNFCENIYKLSSEGLSETNLKN
jgi:ABC-type bacteriocin/lantibiotic exporter with double-glycine peptidase domain